MTIIKKGVNKLGTAWSRKVNIQTIADDGTGTILHAHVIPPYVWPGYMWASWDVMDAASGGLHPKKSAEANIFINMVEVPDTVDDPDLDDEAKLIAFCNTHAPIDEAFIGTDSATDDNVDITGQDDANIPPAFARTIINKYHYKLALGANAYPTNANEIRYRFQGKYAGHCKTENMVDIAATKLLVIRGNTSVPYIGNDEEIGVMGQKSPHELYEILVENIPGRGDEPIGVGDANLNANLDYWLNTGNRYGNTVSDYFDAQELQAKVYVTTRFDIYEPAPRAMINARG